MELNAKRIAAIFKAFCDENRIRIIQMLQNGERCACNILEEMNITQPTLSHHMKILCDSGVVESRKEGKWMHYSLSKEGSEYAIKCLKALTTENHNSDNKSCCEN